MKSTIYSYLSNIKASGQLGIQGGATAIAREFEKGRTTYFRTDGFFHAPLRVLKDKGIDPLVYDAITAKPNLTVERAGDSYYVAGDKFMLSYALNLASPYEFITQGATIIEDFAKKNKKPKDFEDVPESLFIGLEQRLDEYKMLNNRAELPDFKFSEFIQECSARIKVKENVIDQKDVASVSKRIPVKFTYEDMNF